MGESTASQSYTDATLCYIHRIRSERRATTADIDVCGGYIDVKN
jgi:hypothetical protein